MFGTHRIKLDRAIYEEAARQAKAQGCSSVEEYVRRLVEADLKSAKEREHKAKVLAKMKGLGYAQ